MNVPDDDDEDDRINELRRRLRKFAADPKVAKIDLDQILTRSWWPRSFLIANNNDVDVSYAVIIECLKWRLTFGVHNISLLELKPLLERGLAYIHGKDINGASLLWINMRQHKTYDRVTEKIFVYWLERHTMESQGALITLLFDMTSCSLQNMDLDLIKFMLHACKYYYPNCLSSVLVVENPPVLNASWKVIRGCLSTEMHHHFHLVKCSVLQNFIDPHFIPESLGGKDKFIFTMDDLARSIPIQTQERGSVRKETEVSTGNESYFDSFAGKRSPQSVKFEQEADENKISQLPQESQQFSVVQAKRNGFPAAILPVVDIRLKASLKEYARIKSLYICPREELVLNRINGENDSVDVVMLKNGGTKNIIYKVKITSPEKFRVRPSTGVIAPGTIDYIRVYLQNEYRHTVSREKFLLMAVETNNENNQDFATAWKNAQEETRMEHKLKCRLSDESGTDASMRTSAQDNTSNDIVLLMRTIVEQTSYRQNMLFIAMVFIIILQMISLITQHFYFTSLLNAEKNYCARKGDHNSERSFFGSDL